MLKSNLNRRKFLEITAGAGAALAMSTPGQTAVASSSKMIGIQVGQFPGMKARRRCSLEFENGHRTLFVAPLR